MLILDKLDFILFSTILFIWRGRILLHLLHNFNALPITCSVVKQYLCFSSYVSLFFPCVCVVLLNKSLYFKTKSLIVLLLRYLSGKTLNLLVLFIKSANLSIIWFIYTLRNRFEFVIFHIYTVFFTKVSWIFCFQNIFLD